MNSFKRIRSLLLNKGIVEPRPSYSEKTIEQLETLQVPISDDPCRTCADPCDLGHPEYPARFDVDLTSEMLGSVKPYQRQVVISTGKSDWEREITDESGSLAHFLDDAGERRGPPSAAVPASHAAAGVFASRDAGRLAILNGSHHTLAHDGAPPPETVLVFPDYKLVTGVPRSAAGADALWAAVLDPGVGRAGDGSGASSAEIRSWPLPYACVILLCSHKRRDNRCHIAAPKLRAALMHALEDARFEVHTQLDEPDGAPLEDAPGSPEERTAALEQRLRDVPRRALVLCSSHVGGHKFAGNMVVYTPQGAGTGVWYGRVTPHDVPAVVKTTICGGRVLPALLRGGVNLARTPGADLLSW